MMRSELSDCSQPSIDLFFVLLGLVILCLNIVVDGGNEVVKVHILDGLHHSTPPVDERYGESVKPFLVDNLHPSLEDESAYEKHNAVLNGNGIMVAPTHYDIWLSLEDADDVLCH